MTSNVDGPSSAKHGRYTDDDDIDEKDRYGCESSATENEEFKSKHTLDSDEEEDIKYKKLDMSKVEGQEEAADEVKQESNIMPFNMKDDLEEGHFDSEGNFIYDKKEREIKDAWLDNIDWANAKSAAGDQWNKIVDDDDNESIRNEMSKSELKTVYEQIIAMLKPGESIEKALRRLGKQKGVSAAEERKRRWAAKKSGVEYVDEGTTKMKELTGLADSLVSEGQMEVYQYTLERLQRMLLQIDHKAVDNVDMFSDSATSTATESKGSNEVETKQGGNGDEVLWDYKLAEIDVDISGPLSSMEMLRMQQDGKFTEASVARKHGTQTFYNIMRLDFELYV